jgi:hypothetical protein
VRRSTISTESSSATRSARPRRWTIAPGDDRDVVPPGSAPHDRDRVALVGYLALMRRYRCLCSKSTGLGSSIAETIRPLRRPASRDTRT